MELIPLLEISGVKIVGYDLLFLIRFNSHNWEHFFLGSCKVIVQGRVYVASAGRSVKRGTTCTWSPAYAEESCKTNHCFCSGKSSTM